MCMEDSGSSSNGALPAVGYYSENRSGSSCFGSFLREDVKHGRIITLLLVFPFLRIPRVRLGTSLVK